MTDFPGAGRPALLGFSAEELPWVGEPSGNNSRGLIDLNNAGECLNKGMGSPLATSAVGRGLGCLEKPWAAALQHQLHRLVPFTANILDTDCETQGWVLPVLSTVNQSA